MRHGVNKRTITLANAAAYGTGWGIDSAGQLVTEGGDLTGYVESSAVAAVQPFLGNRRQQEDAGTQEEDRLKAYVYATAGVFPTIRGGPDLPPTHLPTLIQWGGSWYEVQVVRDWKHGLLPHIYVEAEKLALLRPATKTTEDTDVPANKTVW